jgi:hypothetical protein
VFDVDDDDEDDKDDEIDYQEDEDDGDNKEFLNDFDYEFLICNVSCFSFFLPP